MTTRLVALLLTVVVVASSDAAFAGKPEIVEVTPGTFMIFKEDHRGIFGSLAKIKASIIKQANEFAKAQEKVVVPVSCKEKPLGNGPAQWASFEYQFRLVSKDDPALKGATLGPCPETVVHSTQSITAEVTTKGEKQPSAAQDNATDAPKDLYTELIKLDDLRKRGIITDAEFEAEKQKLLNPPSKEEKLPEQRK